MKYRANSHFIDFLKSYQIRVSHVHEKMESPYHTVWKVFSGKTINPRQATRLAVEKALNELFKEKGVNITVKVGIDLEALYFEIPNEQLKEHEIFKLDAEEQEFANILAEKLRILIAKEKLDWHETALAVGIELSTLTDHLQGKYTPSVSVLRKYADLLEVSTDFLMDPRRRLRVEQDSLEEADEPLVLREIRSALDKLDDHNLRLVATLVKGLTRKQFEASS